MQEPGAETQALRLFGMVFAVVMALVETEWQFIMTWFKFAENWIARGFVQAFVAVLTMEVTMELGSCLAVCLMHAHVPIRNQ